MKLERNVLHYQYKNSVRIRYRHCTANYVAIVQSGVALYCQNINTVSIGILTEQYSHYRKQLCSFTIDYSFTIRIGILSE